MEHSPRERDLEDLWLSAFPIGTEWESIDKIKEFNWNFENLEKTLEEGGKLYGKTIYLFVSTEPQLLDVNGEVKVVLIPFVVAVDCPFPPSDKIDIYSFQTGKEEIVPMKEMKMAWVPYVPVRTGTVALFMLNNICSLLFSLLISLLFPATLKLIILFTLILLCLQGWQN
ncbi:protein HEAT INTOLERANT 4-like isoform X2 [Panicum virgatum]|uniref:protein HEAT INTOLERANT 4-like isoform X2 n=1 Tax=Panicum virgatum TaxID=38727 RepID=UPI0019D5D87D|nr:protein HEAT INTOLERANT 4-like isoform X2 [Panicum virgatum]